MSDIKSVNEVQELFSTEEQNTDTQINISSIDMNTPEDIETEKPADITSIVSNLTKNISSADIEYISKDRLESAISDVRVDILQIIELVNASRDTIKTNQDDISRCMQKITTLTKVIDHLRKENVELKLELENTRPENKINREISVVKKQKTKPSANSASDTNDERDSNGMPIIIEKNAQKKKKPFKTSKPRSLLSARDIIGDETQNSGETTKSIKPQAPVVRLDSVQPIVKKSVSSHESKKYKFNRMKR
jgi:regulator of replication initiation timing